MLQKYDYIRCERFRLDQGHILSFTSGHEGYGKGSKGGVSTSHTDVRRPEAIINWLTYSSPRQPI